MTDNTMTMLAFAEFGTITWMLENDALNERGLRLALAKTRMPSERTATGNLAIVRDNLETRVIVALAAETGIDASHWANDMTIDVPDNIAYLDGPPDNAA